MSRYTLLLLFISTSVLFADNDIAPIMHVEDSSYQIECTFETSLSDEMIYEILLQYSHVQSYVEKPVLTTSLINEDSISNRINYHYNYLVAYLNIEMNRTILENDRRVSFEQHSYERSARILPMVLSSDGYYAIEENGGVKNIRYVQTVSFDRAIGRIFQRIAINETTEFLEVLVDYMEDQEADLTITTID